MSNMIKRIASMALALLMIISLIPNIAHEAHAATNTDLSTLSVPGLYAEVTANATADGTANWTSAGAKGIKANLVGKYSTRQFLIWTYHTYAASTTTLTFKNNLASEAVFQFDYTVTATDGTVTIGTTALTGSGTYEGSIGANSTLALTLSVTKREQTSDSPNKASIEITGIKLFVDSQTTVNFEPAAEGGTYSVNNTDITASTEMGFAASDKVTMVATPAEGYSFAGWVSAEKGWLSADLSWETNFEENQNVTACFIPTADGIFGVGDARFNDLTAASTCAAGSSTKVVVLLKDATISGDHKVVLGSTLLIPYEATNKCPTTEPVSTVLGNSTNKANPKAYRTLTLANGASITVEGSVSVAAEHVGGQASSVNIYCGAVWDTYGCINLNSGSTLTVGKGGTLYAWGYVLGKGNVNVRNGGTVYEKMQITDYRGGSNTMSIAGGNSGVFPFNQYYVQNIESAVTLNYGAQLKAHAALVVSGTDIFAANIDFIGGSSAMFQIGEGGSVTKRYDGTTDRLIFDTEGDVSMKNLVLSVNGIPLLGSMTVNSASFVLPINGNITINVNSGMASIMQDILLQPGAHVNIDSDAMLVLGDMENGTSYDVYVMDSENWGNYVFSNKTHEPVFFAPSRSGNPRKTAALTDAKVDVNGTIVNMGQIYTSVAGASIISSEGTGVIFMMATAPAASTVGQFTGDKTVEKINVNPAQLKNGNTTVPFTNTEGAAMMDIFLYDTFKDMWMKPTADLTLTYDANGGSGEPAAQTVTLAGLQSMTETHIMAISDTEPTKPNAEFQGWSLSKDGAVVAQPGDMPVVIGENTTLYAIWKTTIPTYTIKFLNEDGSEFKTLTVEQGKTPDPEGIPTKAGDAQYTAYKFEGWDSNNDGVADTVVAATADAAYKAVFTGTGLKTYDVVFYDEDGTTILYTAEDVAYGRKPSFEGSVPTKAADATNHYSFAGWTATKGGAVGDVVAVNGTNLSYYAVYTGAAHSFGEWTVTTNPTCNDAGEKTRSCSGCGKTESEAVSANGHTPAEAVKENEKAATCTVDGSYDTVVYCSVCDAEISRETTTVTATGHTPAEAVKENEKAATCTVDGSYDTVVYCSVCDAVISRETTTVPATGHTPDEAVTENEKAATCTVDGSYDTVVYCSVCNAEISRETTTVPATGHKPAEAVTENEKAATCTVDGSYDTVVYCSVCNAEISRETTTVPASGHTAGSTAIENKVEASCDEKGSYDLVTFCLHCGVEIDREFITIPASGHKPGEAVTENEVAATCGADGSYDTVVYCTVCGEELSRVTTTVPATGNHNYATEQERKEATCTVDGYVIMACGCGATEKTTLTAPGHKPGEAVTENEVAADCTNDGSYDTVVYCSVCGEELSRETTVVPAKGHTDGEPVTENEVAADCTNDGSYDTVVYCSVCGEEISRETTTIPATGHGSVNGYDYTEIGDGTHDVYCLDCGDYIENAECTIDKDTHKCIYCEGLEIHTIIFMNGDAEWTSATCPHGNTLEIADMPVPEAAEGYSFGGWYTEDGTFVHHGMTVTGDLTAYATWKLNTYTLTFKDSNGNVLSESEVVYGAAITYPDTAKEGYTFDSWDSDATTMPANDLTITGTWTLNSYTLIIAFANNAREHGLAFTIEEVEVPYGALLKDYLPDVPDVLADNAAYQGKYSFDYWYTNDSVTGVDLETVTMPATNTIIRANYSYTGWDIRQNDKMFVNNNTLQGGWICVNDNNELVTDGSGNWYYGSDTFCVVTGVSRVPYPTEAINGVTYGPDASETQYGDKYGYTDATTALFVFDENGVFQSGLNGKYMDGDTMHWAVNGQLPWHVGLVQDGEDYYYFVGENKMCTGNTYVGRNTTALDIVIPGVYTFGADGKLCKYDGITDVDGVLYYYENYRLMQGAGLIEIDGDYYYVRSNGALVVGTEYWIDANEFGIEEGMYQFDENGKLVLPEYEEKNGVYAEDGGLFYYENGMRTYAGLIEWNGGWIYVRSNGQLAVGRYWTTKHNDAKPEGFYEFDENGMMIEIKNGIINENGTLYYYINNVKQYNSGIIQLNGNYYYVRSNGVVVANQSYWTTNVGNSGIVAKQYSFDANGVMQNPEFAVNAKEGVVDGYYYENGKIVYCAGLIEWNGDYYYVRSNGQVATGLYWITNHNGLLPEGTYNFGTDGKMIRN